MNVSIYMDIDVDDVIDAMSEKDKRELYKQLGEDLNEASNITTDDDFNVGEYLESVSPYDLKRILCIALNVPSYCDEAAFRTALEPIIKA